MHMDIPLLQMLKEQAGRVWLHMPGHGGYLNWLNAMMDVTELESTDDLFNPVPDGVFERAQELNARACGAGSTFFLTGGATLGIQVMLTTFVPPGSQIILSRDAHKSAIAACAIGGLEPIYVWPDIVEHKALVNVASVISTMRSHPDARAVLLTRPDYFGICVDLAPVSAVARELGMALLVDEAHGAHLPYGGDIPSANVLGADAWVHSAHKTLPALTQAALLHLRDPGLVEHIRARLSILGTSSPSFLIAASLDFSRAVMKEYAAGWIKMARERNLAFFESLPGIGITAAHPAWRAMGYLCDPTRIVLDVRGKGISGYDMLRRLSSTGIDLEMADIYRLVVLPPLAGNGQAEALARLRNILAAIPDASNAYAWPQAEMPLAETTLLPRKALFGQKKLVPLSQSDGCIAASSVGLYPPGIPLAMPGERLSAGLINYLLDAEAAGARIFGLSREGYIPVVSAAI